MKNTFQSIALILLLSFVNAKSIAAQDIEENSSNSLTEEIEMNATLVENLETEFGRHHASVAEALIQLAQSYTKVNLYGEAKGALDRSLQITRLNDGIFSPSQAPVLEMAIQNSIVLGDWEKIDGLMKRLQRLNYRTNEQLVRALMILSDVRINGVRSDSKKHKASHLNQSIDLNWGAVTVGRVVWGEFDPRLAPILYQLISKFYIRTLTVDIGGDVGRELRARYPGARSYQSQKEAREEDYRRGYYLLNQIKAIYSHQNSNDMEATAMIDLYIADWNLLYNHAENLHNDYPGVYARLLSMGIDETQLDDFFSSSIILPAPTLMLRFEDALIAKNNLQQQFSNQFNTEGSALKEVGARTVFTEWSALVPGVQIPLTQGLHTATNLPDDIDYALVLAHIDPLKQMKIKHYAHTRTLVGVASNLKVLGQFSDSSDTTIPNENPHPLQDVQSKMKYLKYRPAMKKGELKASETLVQYTFSNNHFLR